MQYIEEPTLGDLISCLRGDSEVVDELIPDWINETMNTQQYKLNNDDEFAIKLKERNIRPSGFTTNLMHDLKKEFKARYGSFKDSTLLCYHYALTIKRFIKHIEEIKDEQRKKATEENERFKRVMQKELEKLDKKKNKEIEELKQRNARLQSKCSEVAASETELQNCQLKIKELKSLLKERECNSTKVEKYEQIIKDLQNERSKLCSKIGELTHELESQKHVDATPLSEKEEDIKDLNIVTLGGHQSLITRLRTKFPCWKYIDVDSLSSIDNTLTKRADVVIIFIDHIARKTVKKFPTEDNAIYMSTSNVEQIIHKVHAFAFGDQ